MQLKADQIDGALKKKLAPIYFISGDEPLQLGEVADAVRRAAKQAGYENREILTVDGAFSWNQLGQAADALSLFADKKLIDLRLTSAKPGTEGAKALLSYCRKLPAETLLLMTSGKISSDTRKSRWFQALDEAGVVIQVWPLEGKALVQWLQCRFASKGMQVDPEGLKILASRTEGNLLAAAQEVEKLYVLYGAGKRSGQDILDAVGDSSRFDVFKLADSVLAGRLHRAIRILRALRAEGVAGPVVLWSLVREARSLRTIKEMVFHGQDRDQVLNQQRIWDKRKQLVISALNRLQTENLDTALLLAAKADRQFKGEQAGDPWETLLHICLVFSAIEVIPDANDSHLI